MVFPLNLITTKAEIEKIVSATSECPEKLVK